jgi:glycosyltransferase involved in cell wall biosynthesis
MYSLYGIVQILKIKGQSAQKFIEKIMSRKIRVAQVITRMDWGGSPDVLRILCQKLDPGLYDLRIFIGRTQHPTAKTKLFFEAFQDQITFIPELKRDINLWHDWLAFWKLYRSFKSEKFDLVHTHTAKAGALGRIAARLARVPVIIHTPHGHNFYGYFNWFISRLIIGIERLLAGFTDKIIALTNLEKWDYLKFKVAGQEKTVLVYMGLELDKFSKQDPQKITSRLDINPQDKVVGYVGRLDAVKGAQFFVQACRLCLEQNPALSFILVGEGSLRAQLQNKVCSWGLKDKITFLGWQDNVAELMSIMDILVLPSLNEAVGIVLIEAQSLGIPVVASNVGGIPEIIKDQETGLLVKPGDPQDIASAVLSLLNDPARAKEMSIAAKNWIGERFKAEKMVEANSLLYQKTLQEKNVRI